MKKPPWEILSSEYVVESPWYRLRRDSCRLPDGTVIEPYYVREHLGYSVVFALTVDERVVFAQQYKHGFGDTILELPAGAIEPGEEALTCAKRELEEETGYVAARYEQVAEYVVDPTSSTGRLHLFLARDAAPDGVASPDPAEDITTVLIPLDDVIDRVRSGEVRALGQVAAIYAVLDHLKRLTDSL